MEVSFQRLSFYPEDAVTNFETTIDIHDRHAGAVMIECFYWIHPLL